MTGDSQGDWPERQKPRRHGRHSRAPEEYGDPDPYAAPDPYAPQPDSYAPDPYGQPGPPAAPDPYGQPGPPAAPGRPAVADPLTAPGPYGGPDPLTAPGRYAAPDPLASPGRRTPPPDYSSPGRYAGPDPLTAPGRYGEPDRAARNDPYATPPPGGPAGQDPGAQPRTRARTERRAGPDAVTDPSAGRPGVPQRDDHTSAMPRFAGPGSQPEGQPAYPAAEPYGRNPGGQDPYDGQAGRSGGGQDSYDPLATPRSQNGYGRPDSGDALAGNGHQNGYRPAAPYEAPSPQAARGYGPDGYGPAGYGQGEGDQGPYRWRPPQQEPGPEELAPLPDYHGRAEGGPRPAASDWDVSQEHDWGINQDDSAIGLAEPVPGPRGRGPRPQETHAAEPHDWDDEPQPAGGGLIPGFGETGGSRRGGRGGRRRRIGWVLAPLVALVLLVALGAGGYKIYRHFQSPDYTGPGTGKVTVQVLAGDTATSLAPRLVKAGVVASTSSFISAAKDSSNPAGLEPGFFRLHHHMNSAMAYKLLLSPSARIQTVVTIPEGLRETQILQALETKTGTPAKAFTAALKDPAALGLPSYANGDAEGYLFPATYDFNPGTSAVSMLKTMVTRYNQEAASIGLPAAAKTAQLTEAQVITVASILEAEAGNPKYYAEVAEVVYNRLNQDMFLGLDSTVNYALHRFGVSLTQSQLQVNSPYNTFVHKGLPPGPIDSPGNAAIEAALHPDHGDLLYFVTVNLKTGLTLFTSSPTQFQQFENECQQNNAC